MKRDKRSPLLLARMAWRRKRPEILWRWTAHAAQAFNAGYRAGHSAERKNAQKGSMKTEVTADGKSRKHVECPKCGTPYYYDRRNGSNKRLKCPECGLIPTKYCNLCAQELVESMSDRLQAVEAESKSRRKEIASLDEQLIEAKRAIETQYNLRQAVEKAHTALRLASEELIVCVRHGDQEDIGEAMAKVEALLQPAQKDAPEKGTK